MRESLTADSDTALRKSLEEEVPKSSEIRASRIPPMIPSIVPTIEARRAVASALSIAREARMALVRSAKSSAAVLGRVEGKEEEEVVVEGALVVVEGAVVLAKDVTGKAREDPADVVCAETEAARTRPTVAKVLRNLTMISDCEWVVCFKRMTEPSEDDEEKREEEEEEKRIIREGGKRRSIYNKMI